MIAECVALGCGTPGNSPGLRILLYHAVGTRLAHNDYGISIAPELFESHMELLRTTRGIRVVGLHAGGEALPPHSELCVAVTFDDGFKDNLYTAAPILIKYKIPFTVFVTTAFIRSQSREYLTSDELRELAELPGVTIGSHGATHTPLVRCDDHSLWEEINGSRRYLESVIEKPVTAIAYPHGSTDGRVRDATRRAGYTVGVCSRFDINHEGRDPLLLCRSEVIAADSDRVFMQKLAGAWDWSRWRARDPALL